MSVKASTGLRNALLVTGPLRSLFSLGFINLYGGTPPANADDAPSGTLLCKISNAGSATGLTFAATASGGELPKTVSEVWNGICSAGGVCTHYRLVSSSDNGAASATDVRVQGTVGSAGADLVITNATLSSGATQTIDYYSVYLPTV